MTKKSLLILILMLVLILLVSCVPQIKTGESQQNLDKTCPDKECPKLDCNDCETKIEYKDKMVTKYQCYDGSVKDNSDECPKTEAQKAPKECPELNNFDIKELAFSEDSYIVDYDKNKKYDGWEVICVVTCSANCRKGNKKGENVNHYYCGDNFMNDLTLKKTITDEQGNILKIIKKDAIVVYDENFNYLRTECK